MRSPGTGERPYTGCSTDERLGVAFLGRNLAIGGAERVFLHYVENASDLRPVVVLRRREGGFLAQLDPDIPVFDLKHRRPDLEARYGPHDDAVTEPDPPTGFTPRSVVELAQESLRLRYVVQTTGCGLVSSFLMRAHIIALLTKRFLVPDLHVVINIHEHTSESEEHLYPSRLDRFLMRWVVRHLFPVADRIVVVAQSLAEDLIDAFGIAPERIAVVHNPIHLKAIRSRAAEAAPELTACGDRPVIVGVGRLVYLKGFDLLIRALGRLPRDEAAQLVLIGDGPDRADLAALAERLGLADRVHFLGMRNNPWRFMARADVLALPSRTEAFPNVIGESLALGVPVVAAECSAGVREYLENGRGLAVAPNDDRALAEGLRRLLTDDALRERLASRGRAWIESLDLQPVVRQYERTLREVTGLPAAAGPSVALAVE